MKTVDQIRQMGFEGFKTVKELRANKDAIPKKMGVYMVLNLANSVEFLEVGTGGSYKERNPNVSIEKLEKAWVKDAPILYIGKAGATNQKTHLNKRIETYLKFGNGGKASHWGGRYIWQIKNSDDLIFCWKTLQDKEPRDYEESLIEDFIAIFCKLPFANLCK